MRRLAVFASGSGTNFEAIVTACERGVLDAEVVLMVCDKPGAKVVERAAAHEVGAFVFAPKQYASAFRGAHAIEQALEYGVKVFGVTIHYVDAELDGGRIIAQRAFPYEGDDIGELEAMIHAVEYPLYIETIKKLIE